MVSYCPEGLGWTLLESTDALRPLEEVHSRMAELIASKRRLVFNHGFRRVSPSTESSNLAL